MTRFARDVWRERPPFQPDVEQCQRDAFDRVLPGRERMMEWFEKKTLGTLLDEATERWGAREALTYEGKRWSFAQLQAEVNRTARAFIRLGIHLGDRVALWMPNRPEWL